MSAYDSSKWASHLFDIEGSLVREILGRVSLCVLWAAVVVELVDYGPALFDKLEIAGTAHALIGPSLGLLLVFRTNSSYDRFWEGRKQWGSIVNESRNLARQAETWLAADREFANRYIRWTTAFAFAVMQRLRGEPGIGPAGRDLPDEEVTAVTTARHVPLAIARKLTELTHQARQRGMIDSFQLKSMDENIQALIDYCGACERIRSTPAPFGYVVHLRRALIIYCLTLPLALVHDFDWGTVPVTLLVSYVLFGIEEIGVEIENPFDLTINDLPLEVLCDTINRDLQTLVAAEDAALTSGSTAVSA